MKALIHIPSFLCNFLRVQGIANYVQGMSTKVKGADRRNGKENEENDEWQKVLLRPIVI